jgi:hypothetical protein
LPYFGTPTDGDEITFGTGDHCGRIASPDPRICNLHLAIARVSHMSGASEVFGKFLDDDDDGQHLPLYLGSSLVSDDVFMRRLEILAS